MEFAEKTQSNEKLTFSELQGACVPEICFPAHIRSEQGVFRFGTNRCPGTPGIAPSEPRSAWAFAQAKSKLWEFCLPGG